MDVFLCASPLSPAWYPVCSAVLSPLAFSPPDDLFPRTPRLLPLDAESPVVRASSLSPLTPLPATPPRRVDPLLPIFTVRSFPGCTVPRAPLFPLLYRRFPVSSFYAGSPSSSPFTLFNPSDPGGTYNPPRTPLDLYTPRFVRGKGSSKEGLCPICVEPRARGGSSRRLWLAMKFSAYNYHMQYYHGISAATQLPFSPPVAFRTTSRPNPAKHERTSIREAKCHKCTRWIPIEGIKDVEPKVKELFWWKHAATCHGASSLDTANDVYEHDSVYAVLSQL